MEARVTLTDGMHFDARLDTGYKLEFEPAPEHGGTGRGTSPMGVVLAALAGCTAFDVITILRKAHQEVTGLEVSARGERTHKDPKVFTRIQVEYLVRGRNISEDTVKRAIDLSEEKYCSVAAMLKKAVPIEISYRVEQEA